MRLLLDECIDRRFARALRGHDIKTVPQMGWAGIKNGELLNRADSQFEVFVTVDRGLPFQHKLSNRKMAVLVLRTKSNQLIDLEPLAPKVLAVLLDLEPGTIRFIGAEGGLPPHIGIVADAPRTRKRNARATALHQ